MSTSPDVAAVRVAAVGYPRRHAATRAGPSRGGAGSEQCGGAGPSSGGSVHAEATSDGARGPRLADPDVTGAADLEKEEAAADLEKGEAATTNNAATVVARLAIDRAKASFGAATHEENTAQRRRRLAVDRDDGGGGEDDGDGGGGGSSATVRWRRSWRFGSTKWVCRDEEESPCDISKSVADQRHNVKLEFVISATDQQQTSLLLTVCC
ncbi:hypothetical protein Scep_016510 [Stephania cephalantha]|uniref:Uncharacterized protein n=1 Tax=Stephania cephalantha TaxID=152367 RepID=A0AAP0NSP3_9MAGN